MLALTAVFFIFLIGCALGRPQIRPEACWMVTIRCHRAFFHYCLRQRILDTAAAEGERRSRGR